jgi:hypothetical protein
MLSLLIDGNPVDIGDDFSFTMNLKNPIFNALGSYSYPFKIPNTPKNRAIFGFRHRIQSTTFVYKSNDGTFLWNGHPLFIGKVKMQTLDDLNLEGSIIESDSDFYDQAKLLKLNQIDMGQMLFDNEQLAIDWLNSTKNGKFPDFPLACPQLFNDLYFDPVTTNNQLKYYNDWHGWDGNGGLYLYTLPNDGKTRTILVPMLYLQYVYSRIALQLGYDLKDELFNSDPDLSQLVLYNSLSCNNCFVGTTYFDITKLRFNDHIPNLLLIDFIQAIENYFCSATFINGIKKTIQIIPIKKIIQDPSYIDFSKNITNIQTALEDQIFGFNLIMDLDNDDDKLKAMKNLDDMFATSVKGDVDTKADLPAWPIGQIWDMQYVEAEQVYYQMDINKTWVTNPFSHILQSQFFFRNAIKDPKQTIESKFSTLNFEIICPQPDPTDPEGCIDCGNKLSDYTSIVPRLLFAMPTNYYHGLGIFINAANETDNFSLFFPGAKGLFNKFWKEFLSFKLSTRLVKIEKFMTFADLQNFDFSRKYMINGNKYLVKDIQVCIKKNLIQPAIIECYPCK